jgi:iron(III) transport system ATP-binding protein
MFRVKDLKKAYVTTREEVQAVQGVSFEVSKGEIFTLLGPSGCGKSTTLRCVAGLEVPDEGEIWLGDRLVFSSRNSVNVSPDQRDIGMVFQSYAVWPHMTVFENVAFPLRHGPYRLAKREVREKVMQALKLVQMESMADRPAPLLSGGQQQRVALARALVYEPAVLLLDEPLSNLDAKLRVEMRLELKALIKQLQVTALYVTHDQEEGLLLSDRIAVMQHGEILQEGSPRSIYLHPANADVAAFVGQTNLFEGNVESNQGETVVKCGFGKVISDSANSSEPYVGGEAVWVIIRPEDILIHSESREGMPNIFLAKVVQMLFIGSRIHCELQIGGQRCHAELAGRSAFTVGQRVAVELPRERLSLIRRKGYSI